MPARERSVLGSHQYGAGYTVGAYVELTTHSGTSPVNCQGLLRIGPRNRTLVSLGGLATPPARE